jgi:hypothetical protein
MIVPIFPTIVVTRSLHSCIVDAANAASWRPCNPHADWT